MRGQPEVFNVDGTTILRGLLFSGSDEETLLHLAACERIELHSTTQDWNQILKGLIELNRRAGSETITGDELKQLRVVLPVIFT